MYKRRVPFIFGFVIFAGILCVRISIKAADLPPSPVEQKETDVPFNSPMHPDYFKYQCYLRLTATGGETLDSWSRLSPTEHIKKVNEGETFLANLKKTLAGKAVLTDKESKFLDVVWGKNPSCSQANAIAPIPHNKASVSTSRDYTELSDKVSKITWGNWGTFFDGSNSHGNPVDLSGSNPPPASNAASVGKVKYTQASTVGKEHSVSVPLPSDQTDAFPVKKTGGIAAGILLLAGGALLAWRKMFSSAKAGAADDDFDLDIRLAGKNAVVKAEGRTVNFPQSCVASCGGTCNNSECHQGTCDKTCNDTCHASCNGTCKQTCVATCDDCPGPSNGGTCGGCTSFCQTQNDTCKCSPSENCPAPQDTKDVKSCGGTCYAGCGKSYDDTSCPTACNEPDPIPGGDE